MLSNFGVYNHQMISEMISTQSFFVMLNKFRFGGERKKAVKSILKRNFSGKRYKIARNSFIKLFWSKIERSAFNQLHVNVVGLY